MMMMARRKHAFTHTRRRSGGGYGGRNEELVGEATKVGGRQKSHGGGGGRKMQMSIGNGALIGIHASPTRSPSCNDAPPSAPSRCLASCCCGVVVSVSSHSLHALCTFPWAFVPGVCFAK
jgi:hypothetical protein